MIDLDLTEKEFGYRESKKNRILALRCDKCSVVQYDTKARHNRIVKLRGLYLCCKCNDDISKVNRSNAAKKRFLNPDYMAKQKARKHTKLVVEASKIRSKELWNDPEYVAKFKKNFDVEKAVNNLNKVRDKATIAISNILKEKWQDEEYRNKMSQLSKLNWQNEEYRNTITAKIKAYYVNDDNLAALSIRSKQLWNNVEFREKWIKSFLASIDSDKIRQTNKKNWQNKEYRNKIKSHWDDEKKLWMSKLCSEWWTDERKSELAEQMIERWSDPEFKSKMIQIFKDSWTEERRQLTRESWTQERRNLASEKSRKLWEDDNYVTKIMQSLAAPSSLELIFQSILDDYDLQYETQWKVGPYRVDFKIDDKLIEIQGDYWHALPKTVNKDKAKASYINKYFPNLKLYYIWEHEFYNVNKIKSYVEQMFVSNYDRIEVDFKKLKFEINVNINDVKPLFDKYHYKGSVGRLGYCFGVKYDSIYIASCIFTNPTRNINGGELTRFVIHPRYQVKNLASWFLSRASKHAKHKYESLFTFADPNFNNYGTIYLASNWKYVGDTKKDYWYVSVDGWVMHKKTLYNRAINHGLKEKEYADKFGYVKVWGLPKKKYVY